MSVLRSVRRLIVASACLAPVAALGQETEPLELAAYDTLIGEADRAHWAFQPVKRPEVPAVNDSAWVRNPIDAFVLATLEEAGWRPSPPAEPRALLRRVHLDLGGLPPTIVEQESFLHDDRPDALDRVVEGLLARPAYAERWARHWLDLVRYADTGGYELDPVKPHVWRYRDWVIGSLAQDKPFDRFVVEQLAGDELPDSNADTLIATGYYRLGPFDPEPADRAEDRFDQLDDLVSTTSQAFLGLTIGCARCHDHKFEPLTMHDYYRLVAVVNPLVRPERVRKELDLPIGTPDELAKLAERDRLIADLEAQIALLAAPVRAAYLATRPDWLPADVQQAFLKEPAQRTEIEELFVEDHEPRLLKEVAATFDDQTRRQVAEREEQIAALQAATPDLPRGFFFYEPASRPPPVTHLLIRGKAAQPGPEVAPGLPTVLAAEQPEFPPAARTSGRRLGLARWIADPANPLTARLIVNRVWQHHFGEGLVRTPSDFGVMGDAPTHPELLDWLADWFVRDGWSLKRLHRLILASNTYRMSKALDPEYAAADPQNRKLWRFPYQRLEVEAIRDSMLAVGGNLNTALLGPSVYPFVPPEALAGHSDPGSIWPEFDEAASSRRTIYAFLKRSLVVPMFEVLDLCDTARTSPQRLVTSVPTQALTLLNGDFANRQASHLADRLEREAGADRAKQIERAYLLAVCRPPTPAETEALLAFLEQETEAQATESQSGDQSSSSSAKAGAGRKALEQMCRVIFNLNEFVYTD